MAIQDEFIGNLRNVNNSTPVKKTESKQETQQSSNGGFWSKMSETIKEASSKAKNTPKKTERQKLDDFVKSFRAASDETKAAVMSRIQADDAADKFINAYRRADDATKTRIANRLNDGSEESAAFMNQILKSGQVSMLGPSGDNFNKAPQVEIKDSTVTAQETPQQPEEPAAQEMTAPAESEDTRVYEYTYKPGDTFGRVIMKMGLADGRNLWGPDGDVAYYTKQLNDQGIYGNIPIGTTIRLRRRGWENQAPTSKTPMVPDAVTGKMISAERRA